jgi:hypothetical protein
MATKSDHTALIPLALFLVFGALVAYAIIKGNKGGQ